MKQTTCTKKEENPSITYRKLGDMFNITWGRACQIYKGYKDKCENRLDEEK